MRSGPENAPVLRSGCKRDNNTQNKQEQGEAEQRRDHDTITIIGVRIADLSGHPARGSRMESIDAAGIFIAITIQIIGECEFNTVIALSIYIMVAIDQKIALFSRCIPHPRSFLLIKKR